jgi:hypothetical protein
MVPRMPPPKYMIISSDYVRRSSKHDLCAPSGRYRTQTPDRPKRKRPLLLASEHPTRTADRTVCQRTDDAGRCAQSPTAVEAYGRIGLAPGYWAYKNVLEAA